jgi:hypothetical protein
MVTSRIWFTAAQKAELWERWKNGQSAAAISRALERRNKTGVERIVVLHGGIVPAPCQRALAARLWFNAAVRAGDCDAWIFQRHQKDQHFVSLRQYQQPAQLGRSLYRELERQWTSCAQVCPLRTAPFNILDLLRFRIRESSGAARALMIFRGEDRDVWTGPGTIRSSPSTPGRTRA